MALADRVSGRITKAVIPAAGLGTRLRPATKAQPKEMLPVGRKPTIQYVVEECVRAGLTSILIITGRHKRATEDHFDSDLSGLDAAEELDYDSLGVRFFYVRQAVQRGLGDAVSLAEDFADDDPFVVALGDTIISGSQRPEILTRLMAAFHERHAEATIAVEQVAPPEVVKYGIVAPFECEPEETFPLQDLVEKPAPEEAPSLLAVASRYVFAPTIFEALREIKRCQPGKGNEYQLTDAIRLLCRQQRPVWGVQLRGLEKRYDIGNFGTYFKAFVELSLEDPEFGAMLRGHLNSLADR